MRRPLALLVATVVAAGCAADRPPAAGAPETAAAPAGGSGPGPAMLVGALIGAGLIILIISSSGLSPSPDPPG